MDVESIEKSDIENTNISRVFDIFFETSKTTGNTFEDHAVAQKQLLEHIRTMDRETFIHTFSEMVEDGLPIVWLYDQIRNPARIS